mmetsp:Transcript_22531/g.50755  ORF Transcript_22531/g.50755 Transcript_22531/m.50755 type:complete len:1065 (-) Transcript_22531:1137-4331(-)
MGSEETISSHRPGCVTAGAPSEGRLNVHLICHSHDDVGWLKTVDQYYYGANNSIQHAGVQYILDTVLDELILNPDRKFTYVEQAFFQRWWTELPDERRMAVRELVEKGQLEFINGGWSMHDEACTHFVSMIENTAFGHRFLREQFNYKPRVGWQIDPFGHSATQASLLSAQMGFDALYFARIDWQEAKRRTERREMEMVWQPSASWGEEAEVFTGAFLDGGYGPPPGFCFDQNQCNGGFPVMDDKCLEDENVKGYVDKFVEAATRYANNTRAAGTATQNIMFLMGSDFQYENAEGWYKNLDKIIHHVNRDGRVNAFYSTPATYTDAKHKENLTWPVKRDDFMPLANDENSYWTGFFSSRPTLKRYERKMAGYLQAVRQLQLLADLPVSKHVRAKLKERRGAKPWYRFWQGMERQDVDPLAAAVALAQHHDAVSGTEMQHVAYDYASRLAAGAEVADLAAEEGMATLLGLPKDASLAVCHLLNETVCLASSAASRAGAPFLVVLYNPLSAPRQLQVRVPVDTQSLRVTAIETGGAIEAEVVPPTPIASPLQELQHADVASPLVLTFPVLLPPLCFRTFLVQPDQSVRKRESSVKAVWTQMVEEELVVENKFVRVSFNMTTGLMSSLLNKEEGVSVELSHNFFWYESAQGEDEQRSGAYIFRPNHTATDGQDARCVSADCRARIKVREGKGAVEVHQVFSEWMIQTVRLFSFSTELELEWTVGPIPVEDMQGKEVISRFQTNISSSSSFLTDSNGRDILERRRCATSLYAQDSQCRPSVPSYNVTQPVAGNYFPINSMIAIQDPWASLAILVDRAQGGASLVDGQLELMIHRRLLYDDNRGVQEPLNETQSISPYDWEDKDHRVHHEPLRIGKGLVVRGKHVLAISSPESAAEGYRRVQDEIYFEPVLFSSPDALNLVSALQQSKSMCNGSSGSIAALPPNVAILTMEKQPLSARGEYTVLLRVAHKFGVGEHETLSQPATVTLASLFKVSHLSNPVKVEELSLSGNQLRSEMEKRRRRWRHEDAGGEQRRPRTPSTRLFRGRPVGVHKKIKLAPLQVRTFLLYYR